MDTTMRTLEGLPGELVCNIAARLHADDISAFRLVSRSLEQKSFHEFAVEYFSEKCFMFTTDSLKVLVEIAKSARLRGYLHRVHFMTAIFSDRELQCSRGCSCTWQPSVKQKEAFRGYIEDQKTLRATGRDKAMLIEAFSNLPNLTALSVDDSPTILSPDIDYRGGNKIRRLCGRAPLHAPHAASEDGFKEYDAFFRHFWEVIMQSTQTCVSLTHFATRLSKASNGVPIALLDSKKFFKSVSAFKGLTSLLLRIRSHKRSGRTEDKRARDVTKSELKILCKFARMLPCLEVLDLAFDSTRATGLYLMAFTAGLEMSKMTTCYLDGLVITCSGLSHILQLMTSVKDLRLIFTNLTNGSWVVILKLLQTMTGHLKHLHLMYLLEAGCKAYFLKQIEDHGVGPFDYEDDGAFDSDYSDEADTDDDLPPLEPAAPVLSNVENATAEVDNAVGADVTVPNPNQPNVSGPTTTGAAIPSGPPITSNLSGHSNVDHVSPGDDSGERGYYVCVQGDEVAAQLPIFIQEYNVGMDVGDTDISLFPGPGALPPGLAVPGSFNNFMNLIGATLGIPGVQAPGGNGTTLGGPTGATTIPVHATPFGPAPPPASNNAASNPTAAPATNAASDSNDSAAISPPVLSWYDLDGEEGEDAEGNDEDID